MEGGLGLSTCIIHEHECVSDLYDFIPEVACRVGMPKLAGGAYRLTNLLCKKQLMHVPWL